MKPDPQLNLTFYLVINHPLQWTTQPHGSCCRKSTHRTSIKYLIHKSDYLYLSICMQMLEIAKDSKTPLINDSANLNVQDKHIPYAPSGTEMNLTS